jgi:hypothetical protein
VKLWVISQTENTGYDTYDSAVVAAETEAEARSIRPGGDPWLTQMRYNDWADSPDGVVVHYIGEAAADVPPGVVIASFNAG